VRTWVAKQKERPGERGGHGGFREGLQDCGSRRRRARAVIRSQPTIRPIDALPGWGNDDAAMVGAPSRANVPVMPDPSFDSAHELLTASFDCLAVHETQSRFCTSHRFAGHSRGLVTTLIAMILALTLGCDRNIEPYQPGEEASAPDLTRIFPGPPPSSAENPDLANNSRAPDRTALPPSRAEGSATSAASGAAPIEGRVELSSELASAAPAGAILFVIARPQGTTGGPPLAVLRIAAPTFPYAFSIGPGNVMIPSMRFEGEISISARLDADGNAMTRGPEDISSPTLSSLAPGATGVRIVLGDRG